MRTRDLKAAARKAGRRAGESAASWATDFGRMNVRDSQDTARRIIKGFADGDPEVLDSFRFPNLSGEYADDLTPQSLMEDLGLDQDDPRAEWLEDTLCSLWEDAACMSFEASIIRACNAELSV